MKTPTLMLLLALCLAVPMRGYFFSGNELYRLCTASSTPNSSTDRIVQSSVDKAECDGFIVGIFDAMQIVMSAQKGLGTPYESTIRGACAPSNVKYRQLHDIVMKYLKDHPESRHDTAAMLAWVALAEAFPCAEPTEDTDKP